MAASVTVTGLSEFKSGVEQLPRAVTLKLRAVAFRNAHRVKESAQRRVPVDSGYTRDNIHITEQEDRKQFTVDAGTDRPRVGLALHTSKRTGRQHTQRVTLNMLPVWLEYGTVKMRARPFMRPAAEEVQPAYTAETEAAMAAVGQQVLG
jgi:HK97 gp10 family phage protein